MSTPPPARSSFYRWPIRILAVALLVVAAYRFGTQQQPEGQGRITSDLPWKKSVPPFTLTERSGKIITNRDLAGKIWVADFVYTTCPGPCPMITANMARLAEATADDPKVQLVTFTVDPQNDTPAVLSAYADRYKADPNRWWFLTGPEKPLYDLILNGFYQAVQDNRGKPPEEGQFTVTHSVYFVLVDADGNMRNTYDGTNPESRAELLKAIKTLEKESP